MDRIGVSSLSNNGRKIASWAHLEAFNVQAMYFGGFPEEICFDYNAVNLCQVIFFLPAAFLFSGLFKDLLARMPTSTSTLQSLVGTRPSQSLR